MSVLDDFERAYLTRQRNTAAKLNHLRTLLKIPNKDDHRLRAIGRARACLHHCGGIVRRPDRSTDNIMTAGWFDSNGALQTFALGAVLVFTRRDFDDVCDFYHDIAKALIAPVDNAAAGNGYISVR